MITFNLQANNKNYYRGHEPSNNSGNCWTGDECRALSFSIEQARTMAKAWRGHLNIIISLNAEAISDSEFQREVFCAGGGNWHDWKGE